MALLEAEVRLTSAQTLGNDLSFPLPRNAQAGYKLTDCLTAYLSVPRWASITATISNDIDWHTDG